MSETTPPGWATRRRQAGFTLLELLVAVALLGVLSGGLLSAVRLGLAAWERSLAHTSSTDEVRLVQSLLRRQLTLAYPKVDTGDAQQPQIRFQGYPDRLVFLSPAPAALRHTGFVELVLHVVASGPHHELRIEMVPELAAGGTQAASIDELLLAGLAAVEMSYYGAVDDRTVPEWHSSWVGQRRLPDLVRIVARFGPGDVRQWPDLVVAPRVAVDQSCVLELSTGGCRGR